MCNVTLFGSFPSIADGYACRYIDYHAIMLIVFVPMSVILMAKTAMFLVLSLCTSVETDPGRYFVLRADIRLLARLTLACISLAFGLEMLLLFPLVLLALRRLTSSNDVAPMVIVIVDANTPDVAVQEEEVVVGHVDIVIDFAEEVVINPLECSICLECINTSQLFKVHKCGHEFHKGCIALWCPNKNTCPNCRGVLFV